VVIYKSKTIYYDGTYPIYFIVSDIQLSGLKVIKLRLETSLKSQTSDWLKWRLVAILARCSRFETGFHAQFYNLGHWMTPFGPPHPSHISTDEVSIVPGKVQTSK
jgi:hypothetical protein